MTQQTEYRGGGVFAPLESYNMRRGLVVRYRRREPDRLPVLRRKVGGTEYIITARLSPTARETATSKVRRIVLQSEP